VRNVDYLDRDGIERCFNGYSIVGSALTCR
jgi:hypothetical protein